MVKKYSRGGIVALCSLVYFVSYFSRKDFAAAMEGMISENVISRSSAGLALTMLFVFYGVGQLVSGYLGDRLKPKSLISFGLLVTTFCNLLLPWAPSDTVVVILWGINGFAQAMLWPPIVKLLSTHLSHERFVTANLIVTSAAHIATIILYLYVPFCLQFMSWEAVFFSSAALTGISLIVFVVALSVTLPKEAEVVSRVEKEEKAEKTEKAAAESIGKIFLRTGIFPAFLSIIMCGFLRDGIESWLPTLYSENFGGEASNSILLSVILPIFSIVSITVIKSIHKLKLFNNELLGSSVLFLAAAALCIPLCILLTVKTGAANFISLILAALICAVMHGVNFLLISCLPGRFAKTGRAATVSGYTNACIYIGAAAASYGIAFISEKWGWPITIGVWFMIAVIGAVAASPSIKKYLRFIREEEKG